MSTIDSKVVELKFDGKQFEGGVRGALNALGELKKGLTFDASKGAAGLSDITKAANKVDMTNVSSGAEKAASSFSTMQAVGVAAFAAIAAAAAATAFKVASSFKSSIAEGFSDYNLKVGATQTIMAGTGESIGFVTKQLKELDIYADETIYSLSDMVNNIGKFTNAGVKLPLAVQSMKGISNVAALAGAGTNDAARAMYNLGQAIGQGTVRMMDWRSVENANMGTKQFKQELINMAVEMGQLEKATDGTITTTEGTEVTYKNFGTTLQDLWLKSEVLTATLDKFADKSTKLGKAGYKAATQIKTLPMLLETLRAAAGTGWTDTFEIVIGNLPQAVKLWSEVGDVAGAAIARSADARNQMLGDWKELGGRKALIDGIRNAFEALMRIVRVVTGAWRDIFPKRTGEDLYNLTVAFRDFTEKLKMGADTARVIRGILRGVFAVFGIGIDIIKAVFGAISNLFGVVSNNSGGILDMASSFGEFFEKLRDGLQKNKSFQKFFDGVADVIGVVIEVFGQLTDVVSKFFEGFNFKAFSTEALAKGIAGFGATLSKVAEAGSKLNTFMVEVGRIAGIVGEKVGGFFGNLKDQISNSISGSDFDRLIETIKVALGAGILGVLVKLAKDGFSIFGRVTADFSDMLDEVTNTLKTMQGAIKAKTLLNIALALGVLALSLLVLSTIDGPALAKSLTALAISFAILNVGLAGLTKALGPGGTVRMPLLGLGFTLLAGGLLLFALALKAYSKLDSEDLAQSFIGLAGSLFIIQKAVGAMSASSGSMVKVGAGLILLGLALLPIAAAMKIMGTMDIGEIAASLTVLGVSLSIITNVMRNLPKDMLAQALALNAVAISLVVLAGALKLMSMMSWDEIGRGLVTLGASMGILAVGLRLMQGTQSGALALLVAVGALTILVPVLAALGNLPWEVVAVGLGFLAASMLVLAGAGYILTPVAPGLLMVGAAIFLVGAAMALAGPAAIALATAFAIVVTAITAVIGIASQIAPAIAQAMKGFALGIIEMAKIIQRAAPEIMRAFLAIIESFAVAIIKSSPKILQALWVLLLELVKFVLKVAPMLLKAAFLLLDTIADAIIEKGPDLVRKWVRVIISLLEALNEHMPEFVDAAAELILSALRGFAKHADDVVEAGVDIILSLLDGLNKKIPEMLEAGATLIIDFVNALATAIENNLGALREAGINLARAIVDGFTGGLWSKISDAANAAREMASRAWNAAKDFLWSKSPSKRFKMLGEWVAEGFAQGIVGGKDEVIAAWNLTRDLLRQAMDGAKADIDRFKDKLKELNEAKNKDLEKIRETEKRLAQARLEYDRSTAALEKMKNSLKGKRTALIDLGKEYDKYTAKIERADQKLQAAIQTRNDYKRSIKDQYSDLPDISQDTGLDDYINQLEYANADIVKFAEVLQQLRDMGLSDALYKEFLEKGPDILPFLEELHAGGVRSVEEVNSLSKSLAKEARALGKTTSKELYQAGVDSARGLLMGLRSKRREIEKEMAAIARAIQKVIKLQLKIKSPSQVMEEVGKNIGAGLARGIRNSVPAVESATSTLGEGALEAMKSSISGISEFIDADMTLNPTITPVLDLSGVRKDATQVGSLLSDQQISLDAAYLKAKNAATSYQANREVAQQTTTAESISPPGGFVFNQNNYSPKALSAAEIYRQTKNQLSITKGALTNATPGP